MNKTLISILVISLLVVSAVNAVDLFDWSSNALSGFATMIKSNVMGVRTGSASLAVAGVKATNVSTKKAGEWCDANAKCATGLTCSSGGICKKNTVTSVTPTATKQTPASVTNLVKTGLFTITVYPIGSNIYIDGIKKGYTNDYNPSITLKVPVGKHKIKVLPAGLDTESLYGTYNSEQTVYEGSDKRNTLSITLKQLASIAKIYLNLTPEAAIYIDGKYTTLKGGRGIKEGPISSSAGPHQLRISKEGTNTENGIYKDYTKTITLVKGDNDLGDIQLQKLAKSGVLTITIDKKAYLSLDGGRDIYLSDKTPTKIEVSAKVHNIKIKAQGYKNYETNKQIFEGDNPLSVTLQKSK